MARSLQDSSSTRASQNHRIIRRVHNSENRRTPYGTERIIRRVHNSENRRTPYGTEHLHSHVRRTRNHRRGYRSHISFQFTGTTLIHTVHTAIPMMDAETFSLPPADGSFVMPTHEARPQYSRTSVGGTGVRISEYSSPRDCHYPQPSGGFTSGAQMNAVRPGSVTGGYNPGGPGANLTPGVQTPAAGLGPAGSSGVGYYQLTPNAAGQTSQAPFLPESQAAAPQLQDQGLTPGPAVGLGPAGSSGVGYSQLSPIVTLGFEG